MIRMADLDTIYVELSNLKSISSKMERLYLSLNEVESTIRNLQERTREVWSGEVWEQFAENNNKIREKTKRLSVSVQKNRQNLDSAIASYEQTELGVVSVVNDLSAENIF